MAGDFSPVNWLFLGELIVVVIATSAFLFYWNRVLGGAVGFLIRLVTWRWYNAYISIGSLQVSPLAGRIAFRDFEYHSSNISFRALHGNITFRYWKVRVRQDGDSQSTNPKRARLPCRISLYIEGCETFFYNRTPAYDAIVERLKKREAKQREAEAQGAKLSPSESASTSRAGAQAASRLRRRPQSAHGDWEYSSKPSSNDNMSYPPKQSTETDHDHVTITSPVDYGISWFQEAMPMEIKIVTGSVVLGSDATPMVLIADFKRSDGVVDVSEPRSHCDYYKLSVNMALQDVTVLMRTNPDHSGPLLAHGKRAYEEILTKDPDAAREPPSEITSRLGFRWLAKRIPSLFNPGLSQPAAASGLPTDRVWKGLARYRLDDEGTAALAHKEDRQYAKVTTILQTRTLDLCYASDSPGPVPEPSEARDIDLNDTIGNVELPPEYTVDLVIHGGAINYGPWSDRQRDALQKAFIPQSFFDTQPRAKLKPGETRLHATLVVNVTMTEKTTLRIPTREPSKDWMFEGKKLDSERRYGWLDVVVGPNSSICYTQSQVPGPFGYDSMLLLHLDSLDIASSVNLESFVVAKTCKLSMTMPTPLVWNAQRNWGLDLTLDTPDIRLMREHVALISDLSRDWSSGAAGDFHHFVPVHYSFRVSLVRYAIHLYINDFNIVDAPRSRDANAFCDLLGPRLDAYVAVSSTRYKPEFSIVPFSIDAKDVRVELSLPSWDTHRTFGKSPLEVGKIGNVGVSGSYRYYSTPKPDHQEKLKLHIQGERVAFIALGWAIRRLFCVKDNYFGSFTQFSTMQEFLEKFDHSPDSVGDPIMEKYRPGRSDSFAVHLTVDVVESFVFMSDQIYGAEQGIVIPVPQLQIDLKTNEFQMDMTLDVAPTYAIRCPSIPDGYKNMAAPLARSQDVLFVEGIFIKANRLFGPQPRATTYFCLWELSFARIAAFLSPEFIETLSAVGAAVGYNFSDRDNAPASIYIAQTPPDATFVKFSVNHATVVLTTGQSGLDGIAIELTKGLFVDTSSMASKACRSVLGFGIPTIHAHVLHRRSSSRGWEPVGSLGTGLSLDIYRIPEDWQTEAQAQHKFLQEQDEPTRRVPYLYGESDGAWLGRHVNQIYLPRPRPGDVSWHDSSSVYTSGSRLHEMGTSSADRSDDSRPSIPLSRMSRRPRSKSVAQPAGGISDDNSIGDESDSVSSISTSSSVSSRAHADQAMDMCSILEDRLQSFQRIHQRAQRMFTHTAAVVPVSETKREMPFIPLSITNGTIFRVSLEPTTVELGPQMVNSVHTVIGHMKAATPSPEILLDQLLTDQVATVRKKNAKPSANLFEIGLPSVDVRAVLGSFNHPADLVQLSLQGTTARIVNNPNHTGPSPTAADMIVTEEATGLLEVSFSLKGLRAIGGRNEKPSSAVSLHDVLSINLEPRYSCILPFIYVSGRDVDVTFHKTPVDMKVQAKVGDLSGHGATPGLPIIAYLVDQWTKVFKSLPKLPENHAQANLIYDTLRKVAQRPDIPLPAFAHEGSYGLHVQDQRSIRRDPGWFTLARLRQWMRASSDVVDDNIPRPPPPEMARMVVVELARIDAPMGVTEDLVVAQPFLHKAFGKDLKTAGLTPVVHVSKSVAVFVGVESLAIRHYGRLLETGAIANSSIQLESSTLASHKTITWDDGVPVTEVRTLATLQKVTVDLQNSFMAAVQAILTHVDTHRKEIRELHVVQTFDHASTIVTDVHLTRVNVGATAGGLRLDLSLDGGQATATIARRQRSEHQSWRNQESTNSLIMCHELSAVLKEAPSTANTAEQSTADRSLIVAAIEGLNGSMNKSSDSNDTKSGITRLVLGVKKLDFDSRPQLKAFYDFARSWRDDHYHLYKPTFEQAKAVAARRRTPASTPALSIKSAPRGPQQLMIDLSVEGVQLQARVAKGLWLGWEMGKVYATRQGADDSIQFGLNVQPQTIGAYTAPKRVKTKDSSVIRLPSISATGSHRKFRDRTSVSARIQLGIFTGIIKPAVVDRLLNLHKKIGNDVVEVIKEYSVHSDKPPPPELAPAKPKSEPILFNLTASFGGVRIGVRADDVPTTLMFEALNLYAQVGNSEGHSLMWYIKANHVGLSLIRLTEDLSTTSTEPARGPRSVSMTCDITAQERPGTKTSPAQVSVVISRVHTVMHLAALSEVSDLIRSWTSDITVLREVHREEMDEVKEQTSKVLKKLDATRSSKASYAGSVTSVGSGTATPSELHIVTDPTGAVAIEHWFAARLLTFEIKGLGVAIPLETASTIDVSNHSSGPALLYSIREISLVTSRNETARFRVQQTSLQFVDEFDPNNESHFSHGHHHKATNHMVLPIIDAEAQMTSNKQTWSVNAHCTATDFKLTLTPDIADRVARLGDMYEDGKAQLSAMQREYLTEWMKSDESTEALTAKYEKTTATAAPGKQVIVRMSFRFDSGLVELHRVSPFVKPDDKDHKPGKSRPTHDNIVLPTVSVWMDYTGPGIGDSNVGTLLFNTAVHESRNTLRPTILPFFVDIVSRIEKRAKSRPPPPMSPKVSKVPTPKVSPRISTRALPDSPSVSMFTERAVERIAEAPTGKLRVRVTLRIDRSELRLSCAPDSNAYIDLKWEAGGFSVSALLGGKDTTSIAGTVSGVTAYLSHEFADKDRGCVTAGAKDMAFTVTLCSAEQSRRGLSVVVDTEVAVQFRLEAFSAWLIFMSVWVDNAPKISALRAETEPAPTPLSPATAQTPAIVVAPPAQSSNKLGVAVLIRLRSVDFDANVSVTQARLQLTPITVRTVSDGEKTEIEASITRTQITAEGEISGDIRSDNLKFTTVRRSSRATDAADPTVLSLAIEGGDLQGNMFINNLNIVRFRLEPTKVTLKDNWGAFAVPHDPDAHVALDFIVNAGKFSGVLRLPAIPRLLGHFYSIFDLVESQNKIAMQRSDTFKNRQKRHLTESTPMTTVVLPTAQSLTGPSARPSHIKTAQRMRFEIVGVDVGIFADDYEDGTTADFYRFHIGKVEADLKRREERPSGLPLRDLLLSVSFAAWQTSDGRRAARIEKEQHDLTPTDLITASMKHGHRDVVTLPSMTLTMVSTESKDPAVLHYDFDVVWGETNGDIMILPNFFDAAIKSFKKLMSGIDDQALKRARRRGLIAARRKKGEAQPEQPRELEKLAYTRRGAGPWKNPIPRLRALGETTGDAAMLIPKIRSSVGNLPTWSHRFVTLPLEDGMDLLLKLYERQMPDLSEEEAASVSK